MRADRLPSILMMLQIRGQITARELAQRLEVSERTIYRDIEALSTAGVPVYAERGPGGGCVLAEGYRTNLTGLTEDEVRTLFMPGIMRPLVDLGAEKALDAALLKMLAALPTDHRRDIEHTRQRIYVDTVGWYYVTDVSPYLHMLREAVWNDRKVRLVYRKSDGEKSERVVDPLGLVAKAGIWYLVAISHNDLRVFRISRVQQAEVLDEGSERPDDFDLEQYWIKVSTELQQWTMYPVKLRVSPTFVPVLPQILGEAVHQQIERASSPDEEGWITLTLEFGSFVHARGEILGFGTFAEVLEPVELREAVIQVASGVVEFYKEKSEKKRGSGN
jgi:predicted DNA-binding transcriptional regulator YafY